MLCGGGLDSTDNEAKVIFVISWGETEVDNFNRRHNSEL